MLSIIIAILLLISVTYGIFSDNIANVSYAAVNGCTDAVKLVIFLSGSMALWNGIMNIADKSGIVKKINKIISPLTKRILKGINKNPQALKMVNMNITANFLGLGNAATPLGISALKEMNKDFSIYSQRNIAVFTVLNTASIQLIPTTVAAVRLAHGSSAPFEIIPAVLITSVISAFAGCLTAYVLFTPGLKNKKEKK